MWPEPSVSCLISRPLPGSPGQPTLEPRALPREGLAEEENHFSRLACPGQAFLPHPCPLAATGNGAGAQHAQRSPPQDSQAPGPGTPACLGAPPQFNSPSAETLWLQSQPFPRRVVSANLFMCLSELMLGIRA